METWVGHLVSALFGAMGASFVHYVTVRVHLTRQEARVAAVEKRMDGIDAQMEDERDRVQERVEMIAVHVQKMAALTERVIEQNTVLIAELRADRKDRRG